MLHIGICDDNQKDISRVQELAVRFSEQHPEMPVQIQAYSSPYDLLDDIEKTGGFDLYLLDVVMPHMTGVTLARRIRERKERAEILFGGYATPPKCVAFWRLALNSYQYVKAYHKRAKSSTIRQHEFCSF